MLANVLRSRADASTLNVDSLIEQLRNARSGGIGHEKVVPEKVLLDLAYLAKDRFLQEKTLLRVKAPVLICGDIHGQYTDLLKIFHLHGFPDEKRYLFLGDYVDRGSQSVETLSLLLAYKIQSPGNIFILRGNHESSAINMKYGFYEECKRKYSVRLWHAFVSVYEYLPIAAVIDGKIFACHGGLSPDLVSIDQIEKIQRPIRLQTDGVVRDLLWADPSHEIDMFAPNVDRGISVIFGTSALENFLEANDLDIFVRAHEVVEDGYAFFGKMRLVTIFSAPYYCGDTNNLGAVMEVNDSLVCTFHKIRTYKCKKRERKPFGYELRWIPQPKLVPLTKTVASSDATEPKGTD